MQLKKKSMQSKKINIKILNEIKNKFHSVDTLCKKIQISKSSIYRFLKLYKNDLEFSFKFTKEKKVPYKIFKLKNHKK